MRIKATDSSAIAKGKERGNKLFLEPAQITYPSVQ